MHLVTRLCSLLLLVCLASGCSILLPEVSTMPVVHNPFPQLSRVAVTPFNNLSDEPRVDGRQFALAYFAELQSVPGFEVVPLGVVEEAMINHRLRLENPDDVRKLAQILGVDAVVVGAVTDYSPYYPPRCGMRVEWYAANPGFHEIPAGYGLPWGTPEEEYIPQQVLFDAEMALARAQLETQSPESPAEDVPSPMPPIIAHPLQPELHITPPADTGESDRQTAPSDRSPVDRRDLSDGEEVEHEGEPLPAPSTKQQSASAYGLDHQNHDPATGSSDTGDETTWRSRQRAAYKISLDDTHAAPAPDAIVMDGATVPGSQNNFAAAMPPDWPDPRGFIPPGPLAERPPFVKNYGPVMTHTRIFLGHDPEFTAALAAYVDFRDDARFGGWRSYLERSDDFIRFCCHLHISEMLSARGGATETRVVRHWSNSR